MALALHAAGATNRLHTTRRHVQTHRSPEVGHGSYSDAYTGHYTCSTARAPDDILVFNDGTVLQGTADDLCNPAVYVLLLRRDAPAEVAAATDAGLLADNTNTVFGPPSVPPHDGAKNWTILLQVCKVAIVIWQLQSTFAAVKRSSVALAPFAGLNCVCADVERAGQEPRRLRDDQCRVHSDR
jgi:hypothetical protein